jgi:hypothetical protein
MIVGMPENREVDAKREIILYQRIIFGTFGMVQLVFQAAAYTVVGYIFAEVGQAHILGN